jgi:DNA-binding LytR/AlgR family response regulator
MAARQLYRQGHLFEDLEIDGVCPTCGLATEEAVIPVWKRRSKKQLIKVRDISALLFRDKYNEIFTTTGGSVGLVEIGIQTFIDRYPREFARVHRMAIVRLSEVTCVHQNPENPALYILSVRGVPEPVPVSRRLYKPLMQRLLREDGGKR